MEVVDLLLLCLRLRAAVILHHTLKQRLLSSTNLAQQRQQQILIALEVSLEMEESLF
jgi:hypothetical protein